MAVPRATILDRALGPVLGWLFLLSGAAALCVTLILPAWLELRQLEWQHGLMQMQAERMTRQAQRYEQMLFALETDDPVLLERLAYHHFRLKPRDTAVLEMGDPSDRSGDRTHATPDSDTAGIEAWLHQPMPQVGRDYPELPKIESQLVRLTTGPGRLLMMAAGGLCLLIGLFSRTTGAVEPVDMEGDDEDAEEVIAEVDEA